MSRQRAANALYAEVFDDRQSYAAAPPSDAYLAQLLARDDFIQLVADDGTNVVGALSAYVLHKFERERAEIYMYDLAVAAEHRRRGVATRLIRALGPIARAVGAWAVFVQADLGDDPAIALYESMGKREQVLHFDLRLD